MAGKRWSGRYIMALLVLSGAVAALSACGNDLGRETATRAISKKYSYPQPVNAWLQMNGALGVVGTDEHAVEAYRKLESAGLIDFQVTTGRAFAGAIWRVYLITVTAKPELARLLTGASRVEAPQFRDIWGRTTLPEERFIEAHACTKAFSAITGIVRQSDTLTSVEYEYTYVDPTPFADFATKMNESSSRSVRRTGGDECARVGARIRSAETFILYDDGWRMVE